MTRTPSIPSGKIRVVHLKHFDASLTKLWRTGGQRKKKADKVFAILGQLNLGLAAFKDLQLTDHGESRIRHCIKYELGDGRRPVTIQSDKTIALCFVGDHEECEHWLNKNSGLVVTRTDGVLQPAYRSGTDDDLDSRIIRDPVPTRGTLLDALSEELVNDLLSNLSPRTIIKLSNLGSLTLPTDIDSLAADIPDQDKRLLVRDVLVLLLAGDRTGAEQRIRLSTGDVSEVDELTDQEFMEVLDGDQARQIRVGSAEHEIWLGRFARNANYFDWLLFMHPEQESVVKEDFGGPAQLSRVSGSGKTCVVVRRAVRLAEGNVDLRVLAVTLNRSLAGLIRVLVEAAADTAIAERIKVISFFELCQELLIEFEPESTRTYQEVSWKMNEHVDEIFREYYRCWHNNDAAAIMLPIHVSLTALGISAETYTREEFDWICSALPQAKREQYLQMQRAGRKYPIQDHWRRLFLAGLEGWESRAGQVLKTATP